MEEDMQYKNQRIGFPHSILINELEKLCQKPPFENQWNLIRIHFNC
jgi:hypothetical protein